MISEDTAIELLETLFESEELNTIFSNDEYKPGFDSFLFWKVCKIKDNDGIFAMDAEIEGFLASYARKNQVPSRFVWVAGGRRIESSTRYCGHNIRRVCRGDLKYRSVRRAEPVELRQFFWIG
ncbi:hypothetical protein BD293_2181 [Roseinatronobacter monicus]|uniref:Uncharacterized protein n=2 Tax=Roseinatronobacter monicus TaxID=393481 RepID=A0A543KER6_9RHOB|nr:hypothetical protein BD293_2181 [Roseinatronobacter monicus]